MTPQILNWKLQFAIRMKINTLSRKSWRKLVAVFFFFVLLPLPLQHILQDDKMMVFSWSNPCNCLLTLGYYIFHLTLHDFLLKIILVENTKFLDAILSFCFFRNEAELQQPEWNKVWPAYRHAHWVQIFSWAIFWCMKIRMLLQIGFNPYYASLKSFKF